MAVEKAPSYLRPWDRSQYSVVLPSLGASKLCQERARAALTGDLGSQEPSRALLGSWECPWHDQMSAGCRPHHLSSLLFQSGY